MFLDDRIRKKPIFHILDKLSLLEESNFDIKYLVSLILNETLGYFKKNEMT